jgi:hypothetical protein
MTATTEAAVTAESVAAEYEMTVAELVAALQAGDVDVTELTYEQRRALPAALHQPFYDGLAVPHSWCCSVCWDEGLTHAWPCDVATAHGVEVAKAGGMDFSW